MLSTAAFNALLKTLEEPPDRVIFILCTTDPQKVPETIHSRCQRFDFRRISVEEMTAHLGAVCVDENVEFEGEALDLIARRSNGGMRDALSTLEQIIVFGNGKVTLQTAEDLLGSISAGSSIHLSVAIINRDVKSAFSIIRDAVEDGADLAQFSDDVAWFFRDIYVFKLAGEGVSLNASKPDVGLIEEMSKVLSVDRLIYILSCLGNLSREIKTSSNQQLTFEIALSKLFAPENSITLSALAERISLLESGAVHVTEYEVNLEVAKTPATKEKAADYVSAAPQKTVEAPKKEENVSSASSNEALLGAPFVGGHIINENASTKPPVAPQTTISEQKATVVAATGGSLNEHNKVSGTEKSVPDIQESQDLKRENASASSKFADDCRKMLRELLVLNRSFFFLIYKDARFAYDAANNLVKVVLPTNKNFVYGNVNKPAFRERLKTAFGNIGYVGVGVEVIKDDGLFGTLEAIDATSINVDGNASQQKVHSETKPATPELKQNIAQNNSTEKSEPVATSQVSAPHNESQVVADKSNSQADLNKVASPFVPTTISPAPVPKTKSVAPEVPNAASNVAPAPRTNEDITDEKHTTQEKNVDSVSTNVPADDFDSVPFEVYETQVIDNNAYGDDADLSFEADVDNSNSENKAQNDEEKVDDIDEMNKLLNDKFGKGISFKYKE